MKNFDLKKFLTENKLTSNSRAVVKEILDVDDDFILHFNHLGWKDEEELKRHINTFAKKMKLGANDDIVFYREEFNDYLNKLPHNSKIEDIVGWVLEQPVYEDLSPEELGALAKDYLEEWKNSKGNFDSLEEYLSTIEERGDFL